MAKTVSKDPPRPWRTAAVLSGLFLLDLGYAGQGVFSLLIAVFGFLLLAIGGLWSAVRRNSMMGRSRAVRATMYLFLGAATVGAMQFHDRTAENHADRVIQACQAYKVRHGILPERLQELVPEFLPAVPRAKYTLAWGEFMYLTSAEKSHTLVYVVRPPFGRRLYHFEDARWSHLD